LERVIYECRALLSLLGKHPHDARAVVIALRNRLIELIKALGFEPGKEDQTVRLSTEERAKILDDMSEGRITLDDARRLLSGEG
jgi:hypothetical protein